MQKLTEREAHEMFINGTQVEVSKKPTHVFARWVENYDLCTKASCTVENERKNVTGWLVQPQHDKKNLYVLDDEQMRNRYSPSATDSYLYENGEVRYWQFAKTRGAEFISVPQKKLVVFIAQDITFLTRGKEVISHCLLAVYLLTTEIIVCMVLTQWNCGIHTKEWWSDESYCCVRIQRSGS